jgi:hypothetical protein
MSRWNTKALDTRGAGATLEGIGWSLARLRDSLAGKDGVSMVFLSGRTCVILAVPMLPKVALGPMVGARLEEMGTAA